MVSLHWALAVVEGLVVVALWRALNWDHLANSAPLIRDEKSLTAD